ncbi:MAG: DUF934 domain-containing protein [Methylococcales bacterium]|nr:DUF934 domain-containing protein [Methylococcales bacterium]
MQIIKDKKLVENNWRYIKDSEPLTSGDITISLTRWCENQPERQKYQGLVGVRVNSDDNINRLKKDIKTLPLIELHFSVFTDGRGFSHAKLLRDSLNYQDEIRATGQYMVDQAYYLSSVGVNSFQAFDADKLNATLRLLDDFSVHYQQ